MKKFSGREFSEFYVTFVFELIFKFLCFFIVVEKALPLNHLDRNEVN